MFSSGHRKGEVGESRFSENLRSEDKEGENGKARQGEGVRRACASALLSPALRSFALQCCAVARASRRCGGKERVRPSAQPRSPGKPLWDVHCSTITVTVPLRQSALVQDDEARLASGWFSPSRSSASPRLVVPFTARECRSARPSSASPSTPAPRSSAFPTARRRVSSSFHSVSPDSAAVQAVLQQPAAPAVVLHGL